MRYSPWVVSEHTPDFFSLAHLMQHPRLAGKQGQDLAVALWQLMVDRELGLFHYLPARERFRAGQDVYDPLQLWNVFGFTICHCHAHVLAVMGQHAGLKARIACIRGHEGTEFFYDNAWHYFDGDIQMFHRKRPPAQHEIASRQELFDDPDLIDQQAYPSNPYMFPDRLPENMRPLYQDPPHYLPVLREEMHSMDFRLRPGEQMVRYFRPHGRWHFFDNYGETFRKYCLGNWDQGPSETGPEGPTERFWPWRRSGNGFFHYKPKLGKNWRDLEVGAETIAGLQPEEEGCCAVAERAEIVLPFDSPYLYCGVPDPLGRLPAAEGASVRASFQLPAGTGARLTVRTYDGARADAEQAFQEIWNSSGKEGEVKADVDYTAQVEGLYAFKLRIELTGLAARILALENRLWFMVSPHSLPRLKSIGPNQMTVHHGDKYGLATRPFLFERWMKGAAEMPPGAFRVKNLVYNPETYSRLLPSDPRQPWELTLEIKTPVQGVLQWLTAFLTVEGRKPGEYYDGTPACLDVSDTPDGPWTRIAETGIHEHPQGWHSSLFGEARLSGKSDRAYLRITSKKGMSLFRVAGHYVPGNAELSSGTPLEVEHCWYEEDPEVGRRLRSHVEIVAGTAHEYTVHCAAEPHDDKVILRMPSVKRFNRRRR